VCSSDLPDASLPTVDAGSPDAGSVEPPQDGGAVDGGSPVVNFGGSGCSCASLDAAWAALVLLALVRRRP
jgi:hypothetical protein